MILSCINNPGFFRQRLWFLGGHRCGHPRPRHGFRFPPLAIRTEPGREDLSLTEQYNDILGLLSFFLCQSISSGSEWPHLWPLTIVMDAPKFPWCTFMRVRTRVVTPHVFDFGFRCSMSFSCPVGHPNTSAELPSDLCVAPSVRDVQNQDGAVLLDLQQGICFSMTQVGAEIWQLLKEKQSVDAICDRLCAKYSETPREFIERDVSEFVLHLQALGLAARGPVPIVVPLPKILSRIQNLESVTTGVDKSGTLFWKALLGLVAFDLFGFANNFCRTYQFVRGWKVSGRAVDRDIVDRVCKAVNHACVWYPKRVLCLQRSTITTCLLRHSGVPAHVVLGAQKFPFKAHAWTEVDGVPVNERRDVQRLYLVWERC
jgi:hypothetical protein